MGDELRIGGVGVVVFARHLQHATAFLLENGQEKLHAIDAAVLLLPAALRAKHKNVVSISAA
eukprot:scaffold8357_cov296-Pinguiococcus_pyrenoidosus.AAC.2